MRERERESRVDHTPVSPQQVIYLDDLMTGSVAFTECSFVSVIGKLNLFTFITLEAYAQPTKMYEAYVCLHMTFSRL